MAHDVAEMIDTVKAESHWPDDDAAISRHLVRALRHFRHERFYFSEKSDTFNAVAGQSSYERTAGELPLDLLEIDSLRVESGSGELIVEKASFATLRLYQSGSTTSRETPEIFSFHQDKLLLWPTPGSAWVLNFDYLSDSTRDSATGDEIVIDAVNFLTYTNDFFTRGEELLCARILYSLALGRAEDAKAALTAKAAYDDALLSLRSETSLRKVGSGFVTDGYFG